MESSIQGLILDSCVLIGAERAGLTAPQVLQRIRAVVGEMSIGISVLTASEFGHGIYRAGSEVRRQQRRQFLDEVKQHIPIHAVTVSTAEIIARIGGEQAAIGVNLPLADLIIGASALELGYAVATNNLRDFRRIPGLQVVEL